MLKKASDYLIYFLAAVGVVSSIDVSFWLMNQSSSYAFYVGLFLLGAVGFLLVNWVLLFIKNKKDGNE